MRRLFIALSAVAAACSAPQTKPSAAAEPAGLRPPVETAAPNGEGQRPGFAGQTRAPQPQQASRYQTAVVASGLVHPWAVEVLPNGGMLVTERPGRLRYVTPDGKVSEPLANVPKVVARDQGGLLDVAVREDGADSFTVCLSFAEAGQGRTNHTAVSCGPGKLDGAQFTLGPLQSVFRQKPSFDSGYHFGSRIVFAPDGNLFVTTGERGNGETRRFAQDLSTNLGKVIRVGLDGKPPADNPFVNRTDPGALVWSYGHRNIQAAALQPDTNKLWTIEHGARGGDELNQPEAGKNYGWPVITYGIDYSGAKIGEGVTAQDGLEQPVYYWDPVIAPSGMIFYTGDLFPAWKGDILVGGLVAMSVVRLQLQDGRVVSEERLPIDGRVRDVDQGPDGAVYVVTDADPGQIIKITPGG